MVGLNAQTNIKKWVRNKEINATVKKKAGKEAKKLLKYTNQFLDLKTNASLVHIYFKELGVVKYSRDELYGIMDVIGRDNFDETFRKGFCVVYRLCSTITRIFVFRS